MLILNYLAQAVAADLSQNNNLFQLASATDNYPSLPLEKNENIGNMMMMRGMTAKNFDPVRYSGRWFEVASLKRGFAGQGQEDCHCTQVKLMDGMGTFFFTLSFSLHDGNSNFLLNELFSSWVSSSICSNLHT